MKRSQLATTLRSYTASMPIQNGWSDLLYALAAEIERPRVAAAWVDESGAATTDIQTAEVWQNIYGRKVTPVYKDE